MAMEILKEVYTKVKFLYKQIKCLKGIEKITM